MYLLISILFSIIQVIFLLDDDCSGCELICNCTMGDNENLDNLNCGKPKGKINGPKCSLDSQSIVGGTDASIETWPWQVMTVSEVLCGGTLIHPKYVLTAAHCTDKRDPRSIVAFAGFVQFDDIFSSGSVWSSPVAGIIQHPEYNSETYENDISILKLKRSAPINDKINIVCLPTTADSLTENDECYATGWGVTQDSNKEKNKTLQEVCLPYINSETCSQKYYANFEINVTAGMFCAGYPGGGKDSCQGDSGGPYSCLKGDQWKVFGIVSWGAGCAIAGRPGVYTDVTKYLSFIESTIGENQ